MSTGPAERAAAAKAALEQLRVRYRDGVRGTLEALLRLADGLDADPTNSGVLESLRRELHRLHGSAGSYGFPGASVLAGGLEERAIAWSGDPAREPGSRAEQVRALVRALHGEFGLEPDTDAREALAPRVAWLVEAPAERVGRWTAEAVRRGLRVVLCDAEQAAREPQPHDMPHVVIGPAARLEGTLAPPEVPIIALTDRRRPRNDGGLTRLGVTVVYDDVDPGELFEIAARLSRRSDQVGATVLVADDDPVVLATARQIAQQAGLRVLTAADGDQVEGLLARESPSLLLLDISMPAVDGLTLTRRIRSDERYRGLPILLFSGSTDPATRAEALEAGADEFVAKPIVPDELRARLLARLERVRLSRLAEGRHPGTGLMARDRLRREGEALVAAYRRSGGVCTGLVLRTDQADPGVAWASEARRLAAALTDVGMSLGHLDERTLAGAVRAGWGPVHEAVQAVQRTASADAPAWSAGIAEAGSAGATTFEELVEAAESVVQQGAGVRVWTPEDGARAPDVVLVEDDRALSDIIEYALSTQGLRLRRFATGLAALDGLRSMRIAGRAPVVLMDVDLPGLDGHSVHERLQVERPGAFQFVFISVHGGDADQLRALRAGAVDYLTKPLSIRVLLAKLPRWLGQPPRT